MRKKLRNIVAVLLTAVVTAASIPVSDLDVLAASSSTKPKLSIGEVTVGPDDAGTEQELEVSLSNVWTESVPPNIKSLEVTINYENYDSDGNPALKYETRSDSGMNITYSKNDRKTSEITITAEADEVINEDCTLFSLSFTLPEEIDSDYTVSFTEYFVKDDKGEEIDVRVSDGGFFYDEGKTTKETEPVPSTPINVSIESQKVSMNGSETYVEVPVKISKNQGITSGMFNIEYDSRLKYSKVKSGLISPTCVESGVNAISEGYTNLGMAFASASSMDENGTLFTLVFMVSEDASVDDVYSIGFSTCSLSSISIAEYKCALTGGTVTITDKKTVVKPSSGSTSSGGTVVTTAVPKSATTATTATTRSTIELKSPSADSKNILQIKNYYVTANDAGTQIPVSIYVNENEGFSTTGLKLTFDGRLTADKVTDKLGSTNIITQQNHTISIATANATNVTDDGIVYTMYFTLPSNLSVGDKYEVKFNSIYQWERIVQKNEAGYDSRFTKMNSLDISIINGSITVVKDAKTANELNIAEENELGYILGDADLNSYVNAKDAVLVLQEYANMIALGNNYATKLKENSDVNFDDEYNSVDAVFILQYYANCIAGIDANCAEDKSMEPYMNSRGYYDK